MQERTDALQQADRRKDEFLASLAHELRNPLAPIRSAVEVLQIDATPSGSDADRARAVIVRQVDHMTRLIDDLLDVSRITSDKLVLQISRVDLAPGRRDCRRDQPAAHRRAQARALGVSCRRRRCRLSADPARLAQVLSNLLTNAAKYTAPGGDIRLTGRGRRTTVVVRVSDNGIGIEPSMLPRVFELFTQGDTGRDTSAGGLGIGLTLARRLVEMHGGQLEAESDGPGADPSSRCGCRCNRRDTVHTAAAARTTRASPASRRILIVDDNQDAAEMLARHADGVGPGPRDRARRARGPERGDEFEPEIVLLDIGLPRLDGYETARRMREQPWGRRALLIAVTGWGQDVDLARSRDAGFDHHLVKPVDPRVLKDLIRRNASKPD